MKTPRFNQSCAVPVEMRASFSRACQETLALGRISSRVALKLSCGSSLPPAATSRSLYRLLSLFSTPAGTMPRTSLSSKVNVQL